MIFNLSFFKRFLISFICIFSFIFFFGIQFSFASQFDSQESQNDYTVMGSSSNLWGVQFTASDSYTAEQLEIYLSAGVYSPDGDGTWSIRTVSSPDIPLCTGTLDTGTVTSTNWYSMNLSGSCSITNGVDYIITFDSHTSTDYFHWYNLSTGVAGNDSWLSSNNGVTWTYYDSVPAFTFRLFGSQGGGGGGSGTTTPLTTDIGLVFEIIFLIIGVVSVFFFLPWITQSLMKRIPKDPFNF